MTAMVRTGGAIVMAIIAIASAHPTDAGLKSRATSSRATTQTSLRNQQIDPPRFSDPDRRAKLSRAFPDIDRVFTDFVTREHIPGVLGHRDRR
jgi:hypothetical protein